MADVEHDEAKRNDAGEKKTLLDIDEQIAKLRRKGVTFNLCGEDEARAYLTNRMYFFKLYAYRVLFEKHVGGPLDNQFLGLDFWHLRQLASVDRTLRYALLPCTLDVEHYARVRLMQKTTLHEDKDGYSVVSDYMTALNHAERRRREGEIHALERDVYCGDLVRKYGSPDQMPLWVFLELASFGTFIDLYLFCANRWNDEEMRHEHYNLRQSKMVRNACAHSSNIINGFSRSDAITRPDDAVWRALAEAGVSRRVRSAKMRNSRLQQIATLLYLHMSTVPKGTSRTRAKADLGKLQTAMTNTLEILSDNDAVRSSFGFLGKLIDKWF